MILLLVKPKMENGAPTLLALAAGARLAEQLVQLMTKPLVKLKAVNGVPATRLQLPGGALPLPLKPALFLVPQRRHRHQLQCLLAGPILNQSANHIMDYGVKTTLLTLATAIVLVLV